MSKFPYNNTKNVYKDYILLKFNYEYKSHIFLKKKQISIKINLANKVIKELREAMIIC